jgi:hypothetical protein
MLSGNNTNYKWQEKKKEEHPKLLNLTRKLEEEEFKPSLFISTKYSSKYTLTLVSQRKP